MFRWARRALSLAPAPLCRRRQERRDREGLRALYVSYKELEARFEAKGEVDCLLYACFLRRRVAKYYGGMDEGHERWYWKCILKLIDSRLAVGADATRACPDVLSDMRCARIARIDAFPRTWVSLSYSCGLLPLAYAGDGRNESDIPRRCQSLDVFSTGFAGDVWRGSSWSSPWSFWSLEGAKAMLLEAADARSATVVQPEPRIRRSASVASSMSSSGSSLSGMVAALPFWDDALHPDPATLAPLW